MNNNLIQEALQWRYATKKYDSSKIISSQDWKTLVDSLMLAPSSYGIQPWKFLVIENKDLREKLKKVSWNQSQVTDASHYIVFTYKETVDTNFVEKYINRISEVRGAPPEALEGFKTMLMDNLTEALPEKIKVWSQRQAYIAMGFLLETAALLKIDSTPLEGLDPAAYDEILGLDGTGWKTVCSVALGYRHADDVAQRLTKVRFPEDEIIKYIR